MIAQSSSRPGVTNLFAIAGHFVSYCWVSGPRKFLVILWNLLKMKKNCSCFTCEKIVLCFEWFAGHMFVTSALNDDYGHLKS